MTVRQFYDECCVFDRHAITWSGEVYEAYRKWAVRTQGGRILPRHTFIYALRDLLGDLTSSGQLIYGTHRRGEDRQRGFRGLALR